jgi:uncharacterized protein YdeI (BOF family)
VKGWSSAILHENIEVSTKLLAERESKFPMNTNESTGHESCPTTEEAQNDDDAYVVPREWLEDTQQRLSALEERQSDTEEKVDEERQKRREGFHALAREHKEERQQRHALEEKVDEDEDNAANVNENEEVVTDGGATSAEDLIEVRGDEDNPGLEDLWVIGQPLGKIINGIRQKVGDVEEQIEEGDFSENSENLKNTLPIQQVNNIWKAGGTIKAKKTEHAAAIWSDFLERSKKGNGVRYLDTKRVKSILREHFRNEDGHESVTGDTATVRNVVHRAMDALVEMGGNLVKKDTLRNGRSALIINEQEFKEFHDALKASQRENEDTSYLSKTNNTGPSEQGGSDGTVANDATVNEASSVTGGS